MYEVEYLGHIISADGIKMDPKKVAMILAWPAPHNVTALRSFLGLSGFYRKFIELYSYIATLMTCCKNIYLTYGLVCKKRVLIS